MAKHFGGAPGGSDNRKLLLILSIFFLLMFIVLAVFLVKQGSGGPAKIVKPKNNDVNAVEVIVPIDNISSGTKLKPNMFEIETRSRFTLPDNFVGELSAIDGYYAHSLIIKGQPLTEDHVTMRVSKTILEERLKQLGEGYRAVTIRCSDTSCVEGWIKPGSFVDVLWITKRARGETLQCIVEKSEVLSVEKTAYTEQRNATVPTTVTLAVTLEDAKRITLARTTGNLSLILRGPDEVSALCESQEPMTVGDIIKDRPPQQPGVKKPTSVGSITIGGKKFCIAQNGQMFPPNDKGSCY